LPLLVLKRVVLFARYDRFASGIVGLFGANVIAGPGVGSRLDQIQIPLLFGSDCPQLSGVSCWRVAAFMATPRAGTRVGHTREYAGEMALIGKTARQRNFT
jgi:hypothetical protein